MTMTVEELTQRIRNVPDFPQPGIQFKDITTLLVDGPAFRGAIDHLVARYQGAPLDAIVAVESRGFLLGAPLAYLLGIGVVLVRKPGKLPAETYQVDYSLEYGTNSLQIHQDALQPGMRVLIIDDLLATGGTIAAACSLVEQTGGIVHEVAFLIELSFLHGRDKLTNYSVFSLIDFAD